MNEERIKRLNRIIEEKQKLTREIFRKIDEIIEKSLSEIPAPFDKSKFKEEYLKLKEEFINK